MIEREFIKRATGVYSFMNYNGNSLSMLRKDIDKNLMEDASKARAYFKLKSIMYGYGKNGQEKL